MHIFFLKFRNARNTCVRLPDENGPIPQVQEIYQKQNDGNQRLRIYLKEIKSKIMSVEIMILVTI